MRKRTLLALGIGALLPLSLAAPASADVADGTRLKGGGPFCAFTLVIRDVVNQRQETTATLRDGSKVVTTTGRSCRAWRTWGLTRRSSWMSAVRRR